MRIAFLDTETTGLDPARHKIWDIAIVVYSYEHGMIAQDHEHGLLQEDAQWYIKGVSLRTAEPTALRINHFYERHPEYADSWPEAVDADFVAGEVARMTAGTILAGNCIDFDARMVDALLRSNGLVPAWHHHLLDVEVYAAGRLKLLPPWNSDRVSRELGIDRPEESHTAMGDALWSHRIFEAAVNHQRVLALSEAGEK